MHSFGAIFDEIHCTKAPDFMAVSSLHFFLQEVALPSYMDETPT